jgi:hypothetical protein
MILAAGWVAGRKSWSFLNTLTLKLNRQLFPLPKFRQKFKASQK